MKCDVNGNWNEQPDAQGKCTCQSGYTEVDNKCIGCDTKGCDSCADPAVC